MFLIDSDFVFYLIDTMAQHSLTLIILAGGLGSRFGGNKQIAEIPSLGRTIMELSIADAVKVLAKL